MRNRHKCMDIPFVISVNFPHSQSQSLEANQCKPSPFYHHQGIKPDTELISTQAYMRVTNLVIVSQRFVPLEICSLMFAGYTLSNFLKQCFIQFRYNSYIKSLSGRVELRVLIATHLLYAP
jgi:hypothetical protein